MRAAWSYNGRELESMVFAVNYHRWILDIFQPFLGKHLVEVGAGLGSFSEIIMETLPDSLAMIEPSANMFPILADRIRAIDERRVGRVYQGTLSGALEAVRKPDLPDAIIYVNVLEHIKDDVRELATAHSALGPGGRVLVFVPANQWLMSALDHQMGHYRRYSLDELTLKCRSAGFKVLLASYFDVLGIIPWWVRYCLLRSTRIEPAAVRLYDRYIVPISRVLESAIRPPIGKNIILVGQKLT